MYGLNVSQLLILGSIHQLRRLLVVTASWMPPVVAGSIAELMAAWAAAIEARPSDSRQIAQAVAEVAAQVCARVMWVGSGWEY
jgi:hypothetical protein